MELITISETARLKGVSRQTIYNAIARNDLKTTTPIIGGQQVIIADDEFHLWSADKSKIVKAYR